MDTTAWGTVIGAYLLANGLGFLISGDFYRRLRAESPTSDRLAVNVSGMVHFILGMAILVTHHQWGSPLEILVTFTGLGFIAKGFAFIVLPEWTTKSNPATDRSLRLSGIAFLVGGALFGYLVLFG